MEKIKKYYFNILGIDLLDFSHPISKIINDIPFNTELEQTIKKHHLRTLSLSLFDIKDYDEKIYDFYLKRIVNNSDISIYGHIFEIINCAHFINISNKYNLQFEFGNADLNEPDFIINGFGFEIASMRFSEDSDKTQPERKLLKTFRKKNKKKYASKETVLLININQPSFYSNKNGKSIFKTYLEARQKIIKESKFGLVLYHVEYIENVNGNFQFKGTVYDDFSDSCSNELKKMVHQFLLKKEYDVNNGKKIITPS